MAVDILRIIDLARTDPITGAFTWLIIIWLGAALAILVVQTLKRTSRGAPFLGITPNVLAALGVLGTFAGILIGLLDFNVDDIDASVPALLAGLKIAFSTSIFGIAASILFRLAQAVAPTRGTTAGVTPDDVHRVLVELRDEARQQAAAQVDQLHRLRQSIASDGEASLITQVQKLRTTVQDGQSELITEFRRFAAHMVENNQRALIEALREVIRDFNAKLTEQFGDNFKQLNAAVAALVEWQDRYRAHVEAMEARIEQSLQQVERSADALAVARDALENIREHTGAIPAAVEGLQPILTAINVQVDVLGAKLEALAELRNRAVEAFPVIESNLKRVTEEVTAHVYAVVTKTDEALKQQRAGHEVLQAGYDAMRTQADKARKRFEAELNRSLDEMTKQVTTTATAALSKHGEMIQASAETVQRQINEAWSQTEKAINQRMADLDEAMQRELSRALQLMGNKLASLSEKFVSDYGLLVERLRELLHLLRKAA